MNNSKIQIPSLLVIGASLIIVGAIIGFTSDPGTGALLCLSGSILCFLSSDQIN